MIESFLRRVRLGAVLLPAALLLHQGAYALSGAGPGVAHGYLELLVPLAAALAASLALAGLLAPLLQRSHSAGSAREALSPFAFAAALVAIFVVQELAEALLLGGGAGTLAAALAGAWLLGPLALLLGLSAAAAVELLGWAAERLAALVARDSRRPAGPSRSPRPRPPVRSHRLSPLAFGLARRGPPAALARS